MPGNAPESFTRRRILVVDDDDLMRTFYERLFRKHRDEFSPHLRSNAEEALPILRDASVRAAILDWDLPGLSGLQLLRAIRENHATRALPVVIVSGRAAPGCEELALKQGANAYLAKPFKVETLLGILRMLIARGDRP